jgi:hypothetical protein
MRAVRLLASALALAATAALLFSVAPAHAVVTEVEVAKVKANLGVQSTNQISFFHGLGGEQNENEPFPNPKAATFRNPAGHPVLHGSNVFAIYWDPPAVGQPHTNHYHGDWQEVIDTFLQSMGASSGSLANIFSVDTQYTDVSNTPAYYQTTFRGAYTDTHAFPTAGCTSPLASGAITCLNATQLQDQLQAFVTAHGLPTGMGTVYYLLTPPLVTVCLDETTGHCSDFVRSPTEESQDKYESVTYKKAICSYHGAINPDNVETGDGNTILYAAIPWAAGSAGRSSAGTVFGQAAYCQDGGFNPASKPFAMQREKIKTRDGKEQKEFEEKTQEEQLLLEQEKTLQGPHDQEPNQASCPSADGTCDTGLADIIVNQIAIEQQNIVTNPLLNAWQDQEGKEATDECRNYFAQGEMGGGVTANPVSGAGSLFNQTIGKHTYYLNMAFNLAALQLEYPGVPCLPGSRMEPKFTAPNVVNNGEIVAFDGMESDISLNAGFNYSGGSEVPTYGTYTWNFGDGTPLVIGYAPGAPVCEGPWLSPCAASVFHAYQYGGTYTVTLTATDVGGHTASVSNPVTVIGPAPPKEAVPGGSTPAGSTPGAAAGGPAAGGPGSTPKVSKFPAPVAAAAVASRSLRRALRGGLVIRYSVNEQVAGRFEVLLSRTLARRLGIGGAPALGLPAGTAPQVVIGKATLVTTGAGRNTVSIQFSKRTASRLARQHRVPLMLRLFLRNADSRVPLTTTVLSTVTLSG